MKITVSTVYPEAGVNFQISYKFFKLLRDELEASGILSARFNAAFGEDYSLGIIFSTRAKIMDLEIKGPTVSKRYKVVDYVIYIPFGIVMNKETFFNQYVEFVCTGVSTVLVEHTDATDLGFALQRFKSIALERQEDFFELHTSN